MASPFAHMAAGLAAAAIFRPPGVTRRFWITVALCGLLPDGDFFFMPLWPDMQSVLGHRDFSHAILFAILAGWLVAWALSRSPEWRPWRPRLWLCFALAIMSHGIVDGMTTYGPGIAYLSPFTHQRWFLPFQPLGAIGARGTRTVLEYAASYALNEALWVGVPSLVLLAASAYARGTRFPRRREAV